MKDFFKDRWFLLVVLVVFTICKVHHLFYAFYWDESWPYAKAINEMYRNGISLLPGAIDGNLSRGHPLFFHAAAAMWMHIFGTSHVALHSFALFISLLTIVCLYEVGLQLFNARVAALSAILLVTHIIFFVQSSFLFFEILCGLLAFVSIYFYIKKRYLLCGLCLTALFLTKETGLIAGMVIGIDALVRLFDRKEDIRARLVRFAPPLAALLVITAFFLYQKHVSGWYVLPLYSDTFLTKWGDYYFRLRYCTLFVAFLNNGNYHLPPVIAILSVAATIRTRKMVYLIALIPAALLYFLTDFRYFEQTSWSYGILCVSLFTASYVAGIIMLSRSAVFPRREQRQFILLTGMFCLLFLYVSTEIYFIGRYMMGTIISLLFLCALLMDFFLGLSYKKLTYPVAIALLYLSYLAFKYDHGHGDCNTDAFDGIQTQQDVVDYLERTNSYDKYIATNSFLNAEHLTDPGSGFLKGEKKFARIKWDISDSTQLVIFDNIEVDGRRQAIVADPSFKLAYKIEHNEVWAEIYERK